MDVSATNLVSIGKNCTVDKIGNSKINKVKVYAKMTKSKGKNMVNPFFLKSQLSTQNLESNFFTSKTRQSFIKLRKALTETLILHYFDPDSQICISIDAFGYTISEVLSQLTLNNSD